MDPLLLEVILQQHGYVAAAIALTVAACVSLAVNLFSGWWQRRSQLAHQRELEQLRSELRGTEQRLNARFETQTYVSKLRFEAEFSIYRELWDKLVDVEKILRSLRPVVDSIDPGKTEDEIKRERSTAFVEVFNALVKVILKDRPFYSPGVNAELEKLLPLMRKESIEYQYGDKFEPDYWEKSRENLMLIGEQINVVESAIRVRFEEMTFWH